MLPAKTLESQGYATWLPAMMDVLLRTQGSVLEIGGGLWSDVLHAFCANTRMLTTVESDPEWHGFLLPLANPWHLVYRELPPACVWDVVLLDSAPNFTRQPYLDSLRGRARYVVVHDVEDLGYGYNFTGWEVEHWVTLSPATAVLLAT